MTDREVMQQALEAIHLWHWADETHLLIAAHDALREALEQPVQEPVAWMSSDRYWMWSDYSKAIASVANIPTLTLIPLYTTPPAAQRPWQGLTEKDKCGFAAAQYGWEDLLIAAEAKLKERNA